MMSDIYHNGEMYTPRKNLQKANNRIKELEKIIQELYEDNSYWWQEVGEELADKVEKAAKQIR